MKSFKTYRDKKSAKKADDIARSSYDKYSTHYKIAARAKHDKDPEISNIATKKARKEIDKTQRAADLRDRYKSASKRRKLPEEIAAGNTASVGVAASDVKNIGPRKKRKYNIMTRNFLEIGGKRRKRIK